MLPNESLLIVLHFADYRTLALAKLSARRFLRLVTKFAEELASRHSFRVTFFGTWIRYEDLTTSAKYTSRYQLGNQTSLITACREFNEVIGPHAVADLAFNGNAWNAYDAGLVFEAAPPLKYAEDVVLFGQYGSSVTDSFEAFMSSFARPKSLHLSLEEDVLHLFRWTFLREASARELQIIKVSVVPLTPTENFKRSIEELVGYCATLPRPLGGEALELDFSENYYIRTFGLRIIELLKNSRRAVTVRMLTGELELDESEYTLHVDDGTTRYASEENGIVVEVNGRSVTIRSTARSHRRTHSE